MGYFPFNPNPEAWRNVPITIGRLNKEMKKSKNGDIVEEKELEITLKNVLMSTKLSLKKKNVNGGNG